MSTELRTTDEILVMRVEIPPDVILRTFVSETVVLNLNTGQYHALNPTGGHMVDVLIEADNVEHAADTLATEYARDRDEIVSDLCQFCADLERRGLIAFTNGA